MHPPPLAGFEKSSQRGRVRFTGSQADRINACAAQCPVKFSLVLLLLPGKGAARGGIRVHFDDVTGFRVLQNQSSERRKIQFVSIHNLHRHDVVPSVGLAQGRGER